MIRIYVIITALVVTMTARLRQRKQDERGIGTLEYVVIGLGLFLLAGALVGVIVAAVNSRMSQIN
ncbi:hypothetical protein [Nocardioides sp.]|uniref:hypothetical protein n=1 Tax=Nocardioides sp. TaxID=35761 RepID=UPI002733940D|nr:hypothetical protein [Nocardioides sp.]MDP3893632.1 hypothetical protein [Nocardioides sp.]